MTLCECGCEEEVKEGSRFIRGHYIKINNPMNNPKYRKKIGDSKRDKPLSEETCQKMSISHTGVKRGPPTEETKGKISETLTGRTKEEHEYLRRHSEIMSGRTKENHEGVRNQAKKMKGRTKENNESIRRRAKAQKEYYITPENCPMYGKHHTKEAKRKISEHHIYPTGKNHPQYGNSGWKRGLTKENDKRVRKQGETLKGRWENPEFAQKMIKAWSVKPNKPEKLIYSILQNMFPDEYTLNVTGHIVIDGKVPDFVNVNGQKKLIEFNGCYFHHCPTCFPDTGIDGLKESEDRIKLFKKYGYETLVIWGHEMEDMKAVENKILKFHNFPTLSYYSIQTKIK